MANVYHGLAELLMLNNEYLADIEVSDIVDGAPFLAALEATEASNGTNHSYLKQTGAPVVGFRAPNTGTENSISADTEVEIALKILAASWGVDQAIAKKNKKGGVEGFISRESMRHIAAALFEAEKQFIYGTGNKADGFEGLVDASTISSLAGEMVVNAGGSTISSQTSVFLVRTTSDLRNVTVVGGNDGNIEIGETVLQKADDGTGKFYPELWTPIEGWLGLQIGSKYSVGRIVNLETGGNHLNDDLIYKARSMFPAGQKPNLLVMNGTSLEELRKSRTATNATGVPAPTPETAAGMTIVETDAIVDTEEVVA